jgi:hypothetical protein
MPRKSKTTGAGAGTTKRAPKAKRWTARQRVSAVVGGVCVAVLALSVVHVTEAIAHLTGSPVLLAALLAIGIDAGMVACEIAYVVGHTDKVARRWATAYVILAVLLSCLCNGWASAHKAEPGLYAAAWAVGAVIPLLLFVGGKVSARLWECPK